MKPVIHILSICLLSIAMGCSTAEERKKCDEPDKKPIPLSATALNVLSGMGYHGLESKDNWEDVSVSLEGDFETICFSPPVIMSDGMTQIIRIDHKNKQYWTTLSGGIGNIRQEKGPFEFNK
jgi:hypothetical protein